MRRQLPLTVCGVGLAIGSSGGFAGAWAQSCEIKIGAMGPMSGGAAQWGLAM
jgi:hypothetical protein